MSDPTHNSSDGSPAEQGSPERSELEYELSGPMPCATCRYNLSGLSILGRCPECGTLIRDTLLVLVDPFADSVPRVRRPRTIAVAVVGWSGAALLASLALIAHRCAQMLCETSRMFCGATALGALGVVCVYASAFFGLGMLRPMRSTRTLGVVCSLAACAALAFSGTLMAITLLIRDPARGSPYTDLAVIDPRRVGEHLAAHGLLLLATLLYRPNARAVSSASWRLRENHANKQRLLTVAASLVSIIVGDAILLLSSELARDTKVVVSVAGLFLVLIGSGVLAVALFGVLLDSISIARTLWRVPVAFRDAVRRVRA